MNKNVILILTAVVCLFMTSCKNTVSESIVGPTDGDGDETTKLVTLNLNEEQVSMSQDQKPMTRGVTDGHKYYAINVYKVEKNSYSKYAFGLFESADNMAILLKNGDKYKFECKEIRTDEDSIYHEGDMYYYPFMRNGAPGKLTNSFVYSTTENTDNMASGTVSLNKTDTTYFPRMYTYYGQLDNFDPATSNSVTLKLSRLVFGIHFKITPPNDGSVVISFLRDKKITLKAGDAVYDHESIYSFHLLDKAMADGYTGKIVPAFYFTYSNGTKRTETISFNIKRNTMTTVNVDLTKTQYDGISIDEENGDLWKDSVNFEL